MSFFFFFPSGPSHSGSMNWLFAALAAALVAYGLTLVKAIGAGVWLPTNQRAGIRRALRAASHDDSRRPGSDRRLAPLRSAPKDI